MCYFIGALHIPYICTFQRTCPFCFAFLNITGKKMYTAALRTLTVNMWSANSLSGKATTT